MEGPHIERELALIKVKSTGEKRVEALRLADVFRAKVIDAKSDSFVFEVTGNTDKVDTFISLMGGARPGRCRPHRHRRHDPRRRGALVSALVALLGLAVVHLLAVASPGPSTVLVVQTAAVAGRRGGLVAAFAMMLGAVAWAAAALYGLQALFAQFAWLYRVFQVAGGLFLIYLAVMMWRHAREPLPEIATMARGSDWQIFIRALLLQLSNPKIMVFFGSIFLSVLPQRHAGPGCRPPFWPSWPSTSSPGSRCSP